MPRKVRVVSVGGPYHVVARENYRLNILECFEDFRQYSYWVVEYQQKYGLDIISYCFMNNHVHFIVVPKDRKAIARFFNALHMRCTCVAHAFKIKDLYLTTYLTLCYICYNVTNVAKGILLSK